MNENEWSNTQWGIINQFFKDNPYCLVNHHLETYNKFFNNDIFNIFKEKNPIKIYQEHDSKTDKHDLQCNIYLGGKATNRIYYGKPIIYDEENTHFMFPNEARLRNMTYGFTIHYDLEVEFFIKNSETGDFDSDLIVIENVLLGRFPIMLHSDLCIFNNMDREFAFNSGECKNDKGGYFIIDGKEKVIVPQEQFANNMININDKGNDTYSHFADIRSVSEDSSKPVRKMSVKIVREDATYTNNQIVVDIPNVRKPIPFFIVMRALGITSDKNIIEFCLLDMEKNKNYIDLFIPSIHDANKIFTQKAALKFIATFTKGKTVSHVLEILYDYLLPHIGENNFIDKAYFLGHMVYSLLQVYKGDKNPTDRDNFSYKRIETTGTLIYNLFKEYYKEQQTHIVKSFDKKYFFNQKEHSDNFKMFIIGQYKEIFKNRIVEDGFKKAFKGNWGGSEHTKRLGALQDLNRLSFNSALSHLRKINLNIESSAKVVAPRLLHSSQFGIIDPIDTPDGGNVGLHKHMAITAHITSGYSKTFLFNLLFNSLSVKKLEELNNVIISKTTKIFVNGHWIGNVEDPVNFVNEFKRHRRIALIPVQTSIAWIISEREIKINTDSGRLCRPIFYINNNRTPSYVNYKPEMTWTDMITGKNSKPENYSINDYYDIKTLYKGASLDVLSKNSSIIEFIDSDEANTLYIATERKMDYSVNRYTHVEIHPSLMLGVMGNQVVYPENNQLPRDLFFCGQAKQAVSLYHSNYQNRIDKMGIILNSGQVPLVKSRYLEYINKEEHPYGENVIVAIMCYTGYNVEDSILFNQGSVDRGLFRTTYFNMYESRESSSKIGNTKVDINFSNVLGVNAVGTKPGFDYSDLDEHGIIREGTILDDKKVMIGMVEKNSTENEFIDASIFPKKGQLGVVDKSFITEAIEGERLAKVRIREERIPAIGDKFCSRCGQKGTLGNLIPEEDMPFTKDGVKPDIIINPHAIPSRMTIGQLVETVTGKAGLLLGGFGDSTAFNNKGNHIKTFGNILTNLGYHSSANEVLYNGQTGEQVVSNIFIGPTYYMRLKHMVKDKINYRARGPRTVLTRQTVQGRANDGGLRIGEMERDGIIGHGAARFLNESLMERGDMYYMAICNKTGNIAIYNENKKIFISPMIDGPIKFKENINNLNIESVSKYGRDFSIVKVPYSLKLLMQELTAMNIHMRIITEDNINQIENMAVSKTINNLLMKDDIDYNNDVVVPNSNKYDEVSRDTGPINKDDYIEDEDVDELEERAIEPEPPDERIIEERARDAALGAAAAVGAQVTPVLEDVTDTIATNTPDIVKTGFSALGNIGSTVGTAITGAPAAATSVATSITNLEDNEPDNEDVLPEKSIVQEVEQPQPTQGPVMSPGQQSPTVNINLNLSNEGLLKPKESAVKPEPLITPEKMDQEITGLEKGIVVKKQEEETEEEGDEKPQEGGVKMIKL